MRSVKAKVQEMVRRQPDDSSFDEILRELAFANMIEKGLEDARHGRTRSNAEMKRRIKTWRK